MLGFGRYANLARRLGGWHTELRDAASDARQSEVTTWFATSLVHCCSPLQRFFVWLPCLGFMETCLTFSHSSSFALSRGLLCFARCAGIISCTASSIRRTGVAGPSSRGCLPRPFAPTAAHSGRDLVHAAYPRCCLRHIRLAPASFWPAISLESPGLRALIPPCVQQARRRCRGARCRRGCGTVQHKTS